MLRSSRAKDRFGVDTIMLKELATHLSYPLTTIINKSFTQSIFPKIWKSAAVIPVFKKGDKFSVCNYRPISILPTVSKVIEKIVVEQITHYLNSSSFSLHPMQFGFRAKHSTETATCFLTENIKSLLDKGGVVGAIFLDFRKAFDTVNHKVLLRKLYNFNFSHEVIKWVESYLSNRVQSVRIGNNYSSTLGLSTGVPQGSNLGPLLFSLYINDLPLACPNIYTQMYADDNYILLETTYNRSVTS